MNMHQKREAMKAAVVAGAMPRDVADKIVAAERPPHAEFRIDTIEDETGVVSGGEIVIYDSIDSWGGYWGVSADDVRSGLAELGDVDKLTVRINSPGGEVVEGMNIHNLIADHPADVTVMVDGAAYSIASVIALAGDTIKVNRGGEFMVHEAWGVAVGSADEIASYAERLEGASNLSAEFYAARTGGTVEEWRGLMQAETWMYGDEAVARGLADEAVPLKTKPDSSGAEPKALWDAAMFGKNAGQQVVENSTSEASPDVSLESAATAADGEARLRADRVVTGMRLRRIGAELARF